MSNKSKKKECPDCNCPQCPQPKCPQQITMEDIVKAVMPGKSPFYAIGEFHMNGQNVDKDLNIVATDRWETNVSNPLKIEPHNPASQGNMPYSDAIHDKYAPYKLDSEKDMFNLEAARDYRIDKEVIKQLKYPTKNKNAFSNRGNNNIGGDTIIE